MTEILHFAADSGFKPPITHKGRRRDKRLDELDLKAASDVTQGTFANARKAAVAYLPQYDGEKARHYNSEYRNERLRDIAKRIRLKLERTE